MTLVKTLRERAESYRQSGPSAEHTAALLDLAADEIEYQRREIIALRHYGNKDCTAMADDALKEKRVTGKFPFED